jgi:hypothetical protein
MSTIGGVSSTAIQPAAETLEQQKVQAVKVVATAGSHDDGSKDARATVQSNVTGLNLVA